MNDTDTLLSDLKLRFNIDHPSLEECYIFGYECALTEFSEDENPYKEGTLEYDHWQEGWWSGFYGEEPAYSFLEDETITIADSMAANDNFFSHAQDLFSNFFRITSTIAATALIGYQIIELVA